MIANMRYKAIAIAGYLAICLALIYGSASSDRGDIWWLVVVGLLQLTFGALLGTWWAFLIPMALVPMSMPTGYGSGEIPIWFGVLFLVAFAIPLVIAGVLARTAGEFWVRRTGSRSRVIVVGAVIAAAVVALAVVLGYGGSQRESYKGNFSVEEAKQFRDFPIYYAGNAVSGEELSAVLHDPFGFRDPDQFTVAFIYGTCDSEGYDGGCAPPVEISNEPACRRNLAMYGGAGSPVQDLTGVRGAPAAFFENGGRVEIQTGRTTVVIFGNSKKDVLAVADQLRGVNVGVSARDRLPPPAQGALQGKLRCSASSGDRGRR